MSEKVIKETKQNDNDTKINKELLATTNMLAPDLN